MTAIKLLVILMVVVAAVSAQQGGGYGHHEEQNHHPKYHYEYAVHDDHTKDVKKVSEQRDGHHTDSEYRVLEADHKNTRIVKQTIDSQLHHSG